MVTLKKFETYKKNIESESRKVSSSQLLGKYVPEILDYLEYVMKHSGDRLLEVGPYKKFEDSMKLVYGEVEKEKTLINKLKKPRLAGMPYPLCTGVKVY